MDWSDFLNIISLNKSKKAKAILNGYTDVFQELKKIKHFCDVAVVVPKMAKESTRS